MKTNYLLMGNNNKGRYEYNNNNIDNKKQYNSHQQQVQGQGQKQQQEPPCIQEEEKLKLEKNNNDHDHHHRRIITCQHNEYIRSLYMNICSNNNNNNNTKPLQCNRLVQQWCIILLQVCHLMVITIIINHQRFDRFEII